jgi:hypothetical protein
MKARVRRWVVQHDSRTRDRPAVALDRMAEPTRTHPTQGALTIRARPEGGRRTRPSVGIFRNNL